jgi:hypothetical protein
MGSLYILGARQRKLLLKQEAEWNLYECALILRLDTDTGEVRTCLEYKSPPEARASDNSSHVFKSGTLVGNTLYTCTSTEVLVFRLPEFKRIGYVSLPCFNDLHHVTPTPDGNLLVASTGLDMVIKITPEGKVLGEWSVLEEEPWSRFSRTIDYRKVDSTKPHLSHPNYVFELGGEIWVTRFTQRDAICLNGCQKRIEIGVQSPHDGLVRGNRIYFTTVDGRVVIVNRRTLQLDQIIDLKEIGGGKALLGWCRGLLPVNERQTWVGFTRVRKTKITENILWVRNMLKDVVSEKPTHIALYDIAEKRCLQEFDLEKHGMNILFSIFPAVAPLPEIAAVGSVRSPECLLEPR